MKVDTGSLNNNDELLTPEEWAENNSKFLHLVSPVIFFNQTEDEKAVTYKSPASRVLSLLDHTSSNIADNSETNLRAIRGLGGNIYNPLLMQFSDSMDQATYNACMDNIIDAAYSNILANINRTLYKFNITTDTMENVVGVIAEFFARLMNYKNSKDNPLARIIPSTLNSMFRLKMGDDEYNKRYIEAVDSMKQNLTLAITNDILNMYSESVLCASCRACKDRRVIDLCKHMSRTIAKECNTMPNQESLIVKNFLEELYMLDVINVTHIDIARNILDTLSAVFISNYKVYNDYYLYMLNNYTSPTIEELEHPSLIEKKFNK